MDRLLVRTRWAAVIATLLALINTTCDIFGDRLVLETPVWTAVIVLWAVVIELASRNKMRQELISIVKHIGSRLDRYERHTLAHMIGADEPQDETTDLRSVGDDN